jgi:predicted Zn-dependent protease
MRTFGASSAESLSALVMLLVVNRQREAMQLNPFHPSYYRGILGNALEELGRNTEAIEVLTESVRREPDYFSGHLRLASL